MSGVSLTSVSKQASSLDGLLTLALDKAIAYLDGEILPRHTHLRPAHLRLFRAGDIEGLRVTELAARTGMTKQAMHELVRHLERHDYVTKETDPDDERARRIVLTSRGRELTASVAAASARLREQWREALGDELFGALWTGLAQIAGQRRVSGTP